MPLKALAKAGSTPAESASPARAGRHPAVLAVASALLLWFAFPPAGRGYLAWGALVPLFLLVRSERPRRSIYLGAWLGGLVFWLLAVEWVRLTDESAWLAWVVLAAFLSLWWPAFLLLCRPAVRTLRLPLMIAAPIAWTALEYVRAHILTGLPWYYLAHTQYRYLPLIQVADLTGAWGLSFLIAAANAWLAEAIELPLFEASPKGPRLARMQLVRLVAMSVAFLGLLGYGLARIGTAHFREGPRVALLQSNFPQQLKMGLEPAEIVAVYRKLAERSLAEKPDLIVWPETSYPWGQVLIDDSLDDPALERIAKVQYPESTAAAWRRIRPSWLRYDILDWVDRHRVPMLVGCVTYDFRPEGLDKYNSAVLFRPGTEKGESYHKLHLVPFGEYVPLIQTFPWLMRLTPFPEGAAPNLAFGSRAVGFELDGVGLATAICFEDTVPHVVRRFFTEVEPDRRPDALLNISNDGWFHGSSELDMHLAISVFRAVEHRVPMARAVNTGISALIDGNGRILQALPKSAPGVLVAALPLDGRPSLYRRWGDWFASGCLAIAIGLAILAPLRGRFPSLHRSTSLPRLPGRD